MSTRQTDKLDFIGVDKRSGEVVMTVADCDDWPSETDYLLALQDKLNKYIHFWENGDAVRMYPQAEGRNVRIDIVGRFPLREVTSGVKEFLSHARQTAEKAGICLCYRTLGRDGLPGPDELADDE